tara:strand:+ start:619 stop:816 length:198 start_codon:yes stop_codon:yes gene_type:complete
MAETMGNHGYDYDLIVIGGGSGGLVRFFPVHTRASPAFHPSHHLIFQKLACQSVRSEISRALPRR